MELDAAAEVGAEALEHDLGGVRADLGVLEPHHARDGDGALVVGDQEHIARGDSIDTVERANALAVVAAADDDAAVELARVERVDRVSEVEHHEVREIDHVRARTLADGAEQPLEPQRRRPDRDAVEAHGAVPRAERGVLDVDRHGGAGAPGHVEGERREGAAEEARDLAGDASVAPEVGAMGDRLVVALEDDVPDRPLVLVAAAGLGAVEDDDAAVVVRQPELLLGGPHSGTPVCDMAVLLRREIRFVAWRAGLNEYCSASARDIVRKGGP